LTGKSRYNLKQKRSSLKVAKYELAQAFMTLNQAHEVQNRIPFRLPDLNAELDERKREAQFVPISKNPMKVQTKSMYLSLVALR